MNRTELVDKIAQDAGLSKKDADLALQVPALDAITDAVATGEKVSLPGFGTFERRDRAAREGRNPRAGYVAQDPEVPGAGVQGRGHVQVLRGHVEEGPGRAP